MLKIKVTAGLLALVLCGSCLGGTTAYAESSPGMQMATQQEISDTENGTPQLPGLRFQTRYIESLDRTCRVGRVRAATYQLSSSWAADGSDYYFSLLSAEEKQLYLQLKQEADEYMTGTADFKQVAIEGETIYVLPAVSYEQLPGENAQERFLNAQKVINCLIFENPQYYFLRTSIVYTNKNVTLQLYDLFADGNVRAGYTEQFEAKLLEWESQIDNRATVVEKEKQIHGIVCENVSYDETAVEDENDSRMSQSCISAVLFGRETVCAGYAQLFTLLCNRAGIQCVSTTSQTHEWNKVRMGNVWYNVDCTWDDRDTGFATTFLNVTDAAICQSDTEWEHVIEDVWDGLAPACTEEFDAASANQSELENVLVPEKVDAVSAVSEKEARIAVQLSDTTGCDGYIVQYATDKKMQADKKREVTKTSFNLSGLTSGKVYYIRVRGYVIDSSGARLYGAYSEKCKVKVK